MIHTGIPQPNWPRAVANGWHPIAYLNEVKDKPLARRLMGQPLVLYRSSAGYSLLHDRCPHRGMPLSKGRVKNGAILCPYHGWQFGADGQCLAAPGSEVCPAVIATPLPLRIEAGLMWTTLAAEPPDFPELPPVIHDQGLDRFWWQLQPTPAGILDAIENHLDPAHPHFVHPLLVRNDRNRKAVSVEVSCGAWGAQAVYREGKKTHALLPRLMEGDLAQGIGRFWPPSIAEIWLQSTSGASLSISVVFSPVDYDLTRPYAHFAISKGKLPAWLKRLALKAFHIPVLAQDRKMLALQALHRSADGYCIGPLDVLAKAIWQHAHGEICAESKTQTTLWL